MISTYLSYRLYAADLGKSVQHTLADPQVARDAEYYKENIGKVTSIDDFVGNQRLYAYAMKAYGLEDMTYAKAFMKKVLQSDVNDQDSFVNKLVDKRYLDFAKAFNFLPSGGVDVGTTVAQDSTDEDETVGLYSQQRVAKGTAAATEADYYQSRMSSITSVDQLISDDRLFSYALTAYGIDPSIASESAIRNVLTSDLSDPNSTANLYGANYQKLAAAFSFAADGSVAGGGSAQTTDQLNQTINANYDATGNGASPAAAAFKANYFHQLMGSVTNVDDLVNIDFLREYVATTAGLDPIVTSAQTLRSILTSDLTDPASVANSADSLRTVAQSFNFNTDGSLDAGVAAQDSTQETTLTNLFLDKYDDTAAAADAKQTSYYQGAIGSVVSVDDLLGDSKLYNYVLQAFGLDPSEESTAKIRQVLLSNPTDPTSFASRQRDPRYTKLAAAFNFGSDGFSLGVQLAQTQSSATDTISRYTATLSDLDIYQTLGKAESQYYAQTIGTIQSVDQLLGDKRLMTYIKTAYGFGNETISDDTMRKVLTSDLLDPKSFVNTSPNTRFHDLATAFNFNSDGTVARTQIGVAQDRGDLVRTQDLYVRQTMEQTAGKDNEGVRLALYFQRKAPTITSAFSILADKALIQVVMTALGLPDSVSQADVDTQAKLIESRVNFDDFKDPAKVDKFLSRFTALYDLNNPQTSQQSIPSLILNQGGGAQVIDIGQDLLASLQTFKMTV
jgi:hypothetical protein